MTRGRWPLGFLFSLGLFGLVGVLAWLQYRWLGEVSEAERARLQTSLRQRASEFADDFDREITRAYLTFQIDDAASAAGSAAIATRYDTWQKNARAPQLVRTVYLARANRPDELLEYQPAQRALVRVTWPPDLAPIRERVTRGTTVTNTPAGATITMLRDPIVASLPALVLPVPAADTMDAPGAARTMITHRADDALIVVFDRAYIESTFLPSLVRRYFPDDGPEKYRFAVVEAANPARAVFSRGLPAGAGIDARQADATTPLMAFRFDLLDRATGAATPADGTASRTAIYGRGAVSITTTHAGGAPVPTSRGARGNQQYSIYLEQRATAKDLPAGAVAAGQFTARVTDVLTPSLRMLAPGGWRLMLQHPAGSLEAAVGQARRRNLTLSFGILALLCVSVGLIVVNAQRSQRLAGQQMDFVATVSHELRTPLAVIRSAAQNLSAGVVHEPAQARRYGELIESEGRRLTDMIEQVLDYAGLTGQRRPRILSPVDLTAVVHDLVESCRELFDADGVEVSVAVEPDLPLVLADEGAIRRALQNLVTNALKYAADGHWIGIDARRASHQGSDEVQVTVSDRGPGIEAADLAQIFEPFYRGAPARDRQIHGNGLGLSLVKRIAEADGGRVFVRSTPGQGASFVIALPASPRLAEPHDAEAALLPHTPARS